MPYCCGISVTPVRKEPSDRSEMVSQLLYGEQFIIVERFKDWCLIEMLLDGYEGWIDDRAIMQVEDDVNSVFICNDLLLSLKNETSTQIFSYGSEIYPDSSESIKTITGEFTIPDNIEIDDPVKNERLNKIIQDCLLFINVPYLWGGRSAFGIDCSGLMQIVHKVNEIVLPRDAAEQSKMGIEIEFNNRQRGDLAFFRNANGKITHVGMLLNPDEILHSSGWVRIDKFTIEGITSIIENKLSHHLAIIKRLNYTA